MRHFDPQLQLSVLTKAPVSTGVTGPAYGILPVAEHLADSAGASQSDVQMNP